MLQPNPDRSRALGTLPPPFATEYLPRPGVEVEHRIFFQSIGNPHGIPLLLLHPGPSLLFKAEQLRFLDPTSFRIIYPHQRGVGQSTPMGETRENTTELLVSDLEALRAHLGIDKWVVSGWSWGATLGIAYAEAHPNSSLAQVHYGMFLGRRLELEAILAMDKQGNPEKWKKLAALVQCDASPLEVVTRLNERFSDSNILSRHEAMRAWLGLSDTDSISDAAEAQLRVNFHYRVNNYWLGDDQLVQAASRAKLPIHILHGEHDTAVPMESAIRLTNALPDARLTRLAGETHEVGSPQVQALLSRTLRGLVKKN
jgi:proline iminopeptidase